MPWSKFQIAFWSLASLGAVYAVFISCLITPWAQRHALYAHKFHTANWDDLDKPESFGFAERQVTPFNLTTSDGETLYAWHVLPLGLYAKHEARLLRSPASPFPDSLAFQLLQSRKSRLVITLHGNAGHLAQNWRPHAMRALPSLDPEHTHVLALDYRGFGRSTGTPSEAGLITDGLAAVTWALHTARLPPERIVLVGQSLGTGVATGVVDALASASPPVDLAGVVLVAGFSDLGKLLKTYAIGGVLPVLSPLNAYPALQNAVTGWIVDRWESAARLAHFAAAARRARVFIVHAKSDRDIGWAHAEALFGAVVAGFGGEGAVESETSAASGIVTRTVRKGRDKFAQLVLVRDGGHNRIITSAPVALAVQKAFGLF